MKHSEKNEDQLNSAAGAEEQLNSFASNDTKVSSDNAANERHPENDAHVVGDISHPDAQSNAPVVEFVPIFTSSPAPSVSTESKSVNTLDNNNNRSIRNVADEMQPQNADEKAKHITPIVSLLDAIETDIPVCEPKTKPRSQLNPYAKEFVPSFPPTTTWSTLSEIPPTYYSAGNVVHHAYNTIGTTYTVYSLAQQPQLYPYARCVCSHCLAAETFAQSMLREQLRAYGHYSANINQTSDGYVLEPIVYPITAIPSFIPLPVNVNASSMQLENVIFSDENNLIEQPSNTLPAKAEPVVNLVAEVEKILPQDKLLDDKVIADTTPSVEAAEVDTAATNVTKANGSVQINVTNLEFSGSSEPALEGNTETAEEIAASAATVGTAAEAGIEVKKTRTSHIQGTMTNTTLVELFPRKPKVETKKTKRSRTKRLKNVSNTTTVNIIRDKVSTLRNEINLEFAKTERPIRDAIRKSTPKNSKSAPEQKLMEGAFSAASTVGTIADIPTAQTQETLTSTSAIEMDVGTKATKPAIIKGPEIDSEAATVNVEGKEFPPIHDKNLKFAETMQPTMGAKKKTISSSRTSANSGDSNDTQNSTSRHSKKPTDIPMVSIPISAVKEMENGEQPHCVTNNTLPNKTT